jgi:hypothetical protein
VLNKEQAHSLHILAASLLPCQGRSYFLRSSIDSFRGSRMMLPKHMILQMRGGGLRDREQRLDQLTMQ